VTDALGRTTEFVTDALGRVVRSTLPDGRIIDYDYDAKGNLIGLAPSGRPMHTFDLNKVDQETGYTPPLIAEGTGGIASRYNLDKQLTETTHELGSVIGYEYDEAGRLKSRTQPDGGVAVEYDSAGRNSRITTQSGEGLSYDYDGSLQTQETYSGTVNGSVAVEYDNDFNITRHTVNGVESIDYVYDDDGLLTQAGDLTLTRDPQNGLLKETRLNNVTTAIEYNPFGEPIKESAYYAGTLIYETGYTRDKLGQITEKTETIDGITTTYTYEYDNTDRLIGVKTNGIQTAGWSYNDNGNRTKVLGDTVASYDHQDRLLSYSNATRSLPNQDTDIAYVIEGNDRRIARTENGLLTHQWLYADQLNPIAELDGTGTIDSLFIYAEQTHAPSAMQKGGNSYRILSDHLGSPRIVINSQTGEIIQRIDYDVWGGITYNSNPTVQPFGYAGGIHDSVSGLVRFGARDYDPVTGRWLAKDPIRFGGGDVNIYGYVYNNPLKYIDPTGLDATVSLYPGAFGAGHVGIGVNTPNTTGFYPAPGASTFDVVTGQPVPGVMQPDTRTPTDTITVPTTPAQDLAIQDFINQRTQNPGNYDLNDRNCTTTVRDALGTGGVNTPETIFPKTLFENLQQQFAPRP
jgi:RHS repeat-associated protein